MPTERESVINKSLTGLELKELILRDVRKMLDADGMLTAYTAYGRVAYNFRLRMHVDNLMQREIVSTMGSRPESASLLESQPELKAMEIAPLRDPSPDSVAAGIEVSRNVTSPNAERLNAGMPLTVDTRDQDGSKVQREVSYPIPDPGEVAEDVQVTDVSAQARKDWDLQPPAPPKPPTPIIVPPPEGFAAPSTSTSVSATTVPPVPPAPPMPAAQAPKSKAAK